MADAQHSCTVPDCNLPTIARGLCDKHYRRLRRRGTTADPIPFVVSKCDIDGCDKVANAGGGGRGLCSRHYNRWKRNGHPLGGKISPHVKISWLKACVNHGGDECLIFPWGEGRGKVNLNGAETNAARAMTILAHGAPPTEEHQACHSCRGAEDGCVNPRHLSWGTPKQNSADRLRDGTDNRGEKHNMAKLTAADVLEIRRMHGEMSAPKIAAQFGVHAVTIGKILRRERWAWLKDEQDICRPYSGVQG